MSTKLKRKAKTFWKWLRPILVVVVVVATLRSAVADWNDVPTGSMKPTILEGERIFVNKLAYGLRVPFTDWRIADWGGPDRGDVVVFLAPRTDVRMVKRVVAVPGDTMELRRNRLFVNGEPLRYREMEPDPHQAAAGDGGILAIEELHGRPHPVRIMPTVRSRNTYGPITVPDDHYFLMGDNRDNSRDSRYFGFVHRDRIHGRATAVLFSLDPDHSYAPRWSRFLSPMP